MKALSLLVLSAALASCQKARTEAVSLSDAADERPANTPSMHETLPAAPVTTGAALYDLKLALENQRGEIVSLDVHRGHPVVLGMFYASCPSACPALVSYIRQAVSRLDPDAQGRVRVLLVTFDPERDTPERLAELAKRLGVDDAHWTLARTDPERVRELAAVLGVRYRPLESGDYSHSSAVTVVDGDGRIVSQREGFEAIAEELPRTLTALTSH